MTNSKLLKMAIDKSGYRLRFIAKQLSISYQAFLNKINNSSEFKASEIATLCNLLKIDNKAKERIFFADNVDWKSTKEASSVQFE